MKHLKQESLLKAWKQQMRQFLPVILGVSLLFILFYIIIQWSNGESLIDFELVQWIILTDLCLLPFAAVNGVFFAQRIFYKKCKKGWSLVALKQLAAIVSVGIVSLGLEQIYTSLGFIDDDYLQFGNTKFSPSWSNVIEYSSIALFFGLPVFIWQKRLENLRFKLDEKEIVEERLQQLKTQAELHALQSRINPHFLFNAFNSITSLISSNPEKAEKMMIELSNLFRYSINSSDKHLVPLSEEIKMLDAYIKIEKVRFEETLSFSLNCDEETLVFPVPRFILQPLVENSIKYVSAQQKEVQICLQIKKFKDGISIQLFDNGPAFPTNLSFGFGLKSTFEKLELLYGEAHEIELLSSPKKQVFIYLGPSNFA